MVHYIVHYMPSQPNMSHINKINVVISKINVMGYRHWSRFMSHFGVCQELCCIWHLSRVMSHCDMGGYAELQQFPR